MRHCYASTSWTIVAHQQRQYNSGSRCIIKTHGTFVVQKKHRGSSRRRCSTIIQVHKNKCIHGRPVGGSQYLRCFAFLERKKLRESWAGRNVYMCFREAATVLRAVPLVVIAAPWLGVPASVLRLQLALRSMNTTGYVSLAYHFVFPCGVAEFLRLSCPLQYLLCSSIPCSLLFFFLFFFQLCRLNCLCYA